MSLADPFEPGNLEGADFETRADLDRALRTVGAAYVDSHHAYTLIHVWLTKRRGRRFEMAAHHYGAEQAAEIFAAIDHLFDPSPDLSLQLPPLLACLSTPAQQLERNSPEGGKLRTLSISFQGVFRPELICDSIGQCIAAVRTGGFVAVLPTQAWAQITGLECDVINDKDLAERDRPLVLAWSPRHVEAFGSAMA